MGVDFEDTEIRVNFRPGKTAVNFTIPINTDQEFEETEYFTMELVQTKSAKKHMIKLGNLKTATGQIIDEGNVHTTYVL